MMQVNPSNEVLLKLIEDEAASKYIAPINARVDRVWKAIPGYNGLKVNIEQTLRYTVQNKQPTSIQWIYEQIEPSIQLDDLGPYPIYRGNTQKPMCAIMINVAWGNDYIPKMLNTLKQNQVKATFFLDGTWLYNNIELANTIMQEGHEISNHAYSHKNMSKLSRQEIFNEINKTQQLLEKKLNVVNKLFAPPSGDYNQDTIEVASQLNLRTILWTLDTIDWRNPPVHQIMNRITAGLEPGALILMHPTKSADLALPKIIRMIKDKGIEAGTVSQTLDSARL